jgi:hypothetical protein
MLIYFTFRVVLLFCFLFGSYYCFVSDFVVILFPTSKQNSSTTQQVNKTVVRPKEEIKQKYDPKRKQNSSTTQKGSKTVVRPKEEIKQK